MRAEFEVLDEISFCKSQFLRCTREVTKDWYLAKAFGAWQTLKRPEAEFNKYWESIPEMRMRDNK